MGMQCDTADSIANEPVVGDYVLRGAALADPIAKDADSSASYLHAIVLDIVAVDSNVIVAIMLRPDCTHGRMRRKHNAALSRIVDDIVVSDENIVARCCLIAYEDSIVI
jgi:hypothetical protein